jgi:hypothetical protein
VLALQARGSGTESLKQDQTMNTCYTVLKGIQHENEGRSKYW